MTDLLEKAFSKAARLPDNEQDAFARWLVGRDRVRAALVPIVRDLPAAARQSCSGGSQRGSGRPN